jgi:two-component system, LytTR family, response regulator
VIRALIAEDEAPARDKLSRWLGEQADFEVVGVAVDGLAAAQGIEQQSPDVAFLDIQMPSMSGLEVAAQLEPDSAPLLVFVTAYDEHAVRAFDLNAIDYLLKPYDKDRLAKALQRIRVRLQERAPRAPAVHLARTQTGATDRLLAPVGEQLQLIDAADIEWLEADDNYVHVHTAARKYLLRRTLQDLLAQLGAERFARIHKSAAVNVAAIESLTPLFKGDHEITLRRGQKLRMSRRYRDELFARMR